MQTGIEWNPALPPAIILPAAALLATLAAVTAWRARHSMPTWVSASSLALRTLAIGCLCLLVLRPEIIREEEIVKHRPLILLVDDTQSMLLRDKDDQPTRAEMLEKLWPHLQDEFNARGWKTTAFDAGESLVPRQPQEAHVRGRAPASPLGERLAEVLDAAEQNTRNAPAGAVLLLSDGSVNRGRSLADAARLLRARGVPLFALAVGQPRTPAPDAQLSGLIIRTASPQPISGEPIRTGNRLQAEARGALLPGGPRLSGPLADTTAHLYLAGPLTEEAPPFREIESLRHRLPESPAWTPVRLNFTAPESGFYRVRMELDALEGEQNRANNVVYGSFEVLPPQRRAVYIASRLGHDYRHLRDLFSTWDGPGVEIVADFLSARQPGEAAAQSTAQDVLTQWLGEGVPNAQRGGTLIWDEPDFSRISSSTQAKLRAALQSGALSLLWIVNQNGAALHRSLHGSPLEDTFLFQTSTAPDTELRPAGTVADPSARKHPATNWAFTPGDESDPFRSLPSLAAQGRFENPRDGTSVLLRSGGNPLLCAGQVGQGRVALLLTGESWRWLVPLGQGAHAQASRELTIRLWKGLIEWLADTSPRADPPVRLYLSKDEWTLGEQLRARLVARPPDPRTGLQVEYDLTRLHADTQPPPRWNRWTGDTSEPEGGWDASLPLDTGRGRLRAYSGTIGRLDVSGEWLLRARALLPDGRELGQDRLQFVVRGAPLEEQSNGPDLKGMQKAVEAAAERDGRGGRVIEAQSPALSEMLDDLRTWLQPERSVHVTRTPQVSPGGLLGLLILALLVDIWLRRG